MSIGLKRGTVYLENHSTEWDAEAARTIQVLKSIFQDDAVDIQHVGSTSVKTIPAKPIIDIVVGVSELKTVLLKKDQLESESIIFRFEENPGQMLFVMGDFENDTRTHHIHVVKYGSRQWNDYLNFRDYLNTSTQAAESYASLKAALARKYPTNRIAYTEGKSRLIEVLLNEARQWRKTNTEE